MPQIRQIIRKYFYNTHIPETCVSFVNWLRNGQSDEEKDDAFREIWDELEIVADQTTEDSYIKFEQRVFSQSEPTKTKLRIPLYRRFLRVASVLIIPIVSIVGAYWYVENNEARVAPVELVEYFVPNGEVREVVLPDSSVVQLNSGSLLIYPKSFSRETRDLYLNGEGLFSVKRDDNHPFIVKTADMDIKVLGTEFNVSTYHTSERIATTLKSGKVSVTLKNKQSDPIILSPTEQILLDRISGETIVKTVDVENTVAWQRGYLMVESLNIRDISKILERKYDTAIHVNTDKYDHQYVTAKFKNGENLLESMSVLQQLIPGMKYKIEANDVYIY